MPSSGSNLNSLLDFMHGQLPKFVAIYYVLTVKLQQAVAVLPLPDNNALTVVSYSHVVISLHLLLA